MLNELFLTYNAPSLFLELLSSYSRASDKGLVKLLKMRNTTQEFLKLHQMPFLVSTTGELISGEIVISETIARLGGVYDALFGRNHDEIYSNFDFFKRIDENNTDEFKLIQNLNNHLQTRTFCNGSHVTISDLYAYAHVVPILQTLRDDDKYVYCNVIRWADHIQNLNGMKEKIRDLRLRVQLPYDPLFLEAEDTKPEKVKKEKALVNKAKNTGMIVENDISNSINLNESQVSQSSHTSQTPSLTKTDPNKNNKHEEKKTQTQQKEPQQQKGAQKTKENKEVDDTHPVSKLDIRVGKVVNIFVNKDSEKLYNEEIDIGNGEIRKIASGLKGRVNIEDLKDSLVIVLANLKARTLCGWPSHGMILCASDEKGNIEPIRPAEGSQPGDQVFIGDYPRTPVPELNPKKNPWDAVGGDMAVIESNVATYQKSSIWKTNKGEIRTKSVINAKIS